MMKKLVKHLSQENNFEVKLFVVNCDASEELCVDKKVHGLPHIVLYKNGVALEAYDGARTAKSVLKYLKRITGPVVTKIENLDQVEELRSSKAVVVGIFDKEDSEEYAIFHKLGEKMLGKTPFFRLEKAGDISSGIYVHRIFSEDPHRMRYQKTVTNFEEELKKKEEMNMTQEELENFKITRLDYLTENLLLELKFHTAYRPYEEMSRLTYYELASRKLPIFILFVKRPRENENVEDFFSNLDALLREPALSMEQSVSVSFEFAYPNNELMFDRIGGNVEEIPSFLVVDLERRKKYFLPKREMGKLSGDRILEFCKNVLTGSVDAFVLKEEVVPLEKDEDADEKIKKVVYDTLNDFVMKKEKKNVVILFGSKTNFEYEEFLNDVYIPTSQYYGKEGIGTDIKFGTFDVMKNDIPDSFLESLSGAEGDVIAVMYTSVNNKLEFSRFESRGNNNNEMGIAKGYQFVKFVLMNAVKEEREKIEEFERDERNGQMKPKFPETTAEAQLRALEEMTDEMKEANPILKLLSMEFKDPHTMTKEELIQEVITHRSTVEMFRKEMMEDENPKENEKSQYGEYDDDDDEEEERKEEKVIVDVDGKVKNK